MEGVVREVGGKLGSRVSQKLREVKIPGRKQCQQGQWTSPIKRNWKASTGFYVREEIVTLVMESSTEQHLSLKIYVCIHKQLFPTHLLLFITIKLIDLNEI